MPEYLSPGVYVEEVQTGARPIEGVSTSTAGFVGRTERGPTAPRLVTSWSDYVRWFGGYLAENISYLPFAIKGFFDNGGQRAYVARVTGAGSGTASITLPTGGDPILVQAIGPGEWGNHLLVRMADPLSVAAQAAGFFRLTVLYYADGIPAPFLDPTDLDNFGNPLLVLPDATEDYETLSPNPEDSNYFLNIINSRSQLIHLPDDTLNLRPNNFDFPVTGSADFPTADANTLLHAFARRAGAGHEVSLEIVAGTAANTVRFNISTEEDFDDLTPATVLNTINGGSALVTAAWAALNPANPITPSPLTVPVAVTPIGAQHDLATSDANTVLRVTPRVHGGAAALTVAAVAGTAANTFRITLTDVEAFDNLTANTILNAVNSASDLARVQWAQALPPAAFTPSLPALIAPTVLGPGTGEVPTNGSDSPLTEADFIGNGNAPPSQRTGLAALRSVDGVSILCVPDEVRFNTGQITNAVVDQCEQLKDRFAVLSVADHSGLVNTIRPPRDSSYGAVYYPFVRIMDPRTQTDILIPPAGHAVGIYARTDIQRGVHKAPANEVVRGTLTRDFGPDRKPLEFILSKGEQDILNPRGVDVIRDFRPQRRDIRVWGARTMSSDSQWKYVNVRRLFIFVEQSIDRGTQWVVFEPNDETTWSAVSRSITGFLTTVWRSGALFGATADEAFFVKCDRTTMTQDDIDNGRLICLIGIAPVKPAEFVIFRISQKTAEAQA